jgi:hypothetical protein
MEKFLLFLFYQALVIEFTFNKQESLVMIIF